MATPKLFIEGESRSKPLIAIGNPAVSFVWDATLNQHVATFADDAAFNAAAPRLFREKHAYRIIPLAL